MGFSLAALFGFGKKAEPKPAPVDARTADARETPSATLTLATGVEPVAFGSAKAASGGVAALIRAHASAAAKDDIRGAYSAAKVLAEAFKTQGRMHLSMNWAIKAGEHAVAAAAAGAPDRPVVARTAAAAALRFVETGRALAAGPHAGVLRRVCGEDAAAVMASHGEWLAELGFSASTAALDDGDSPVEELAA